MKRPILVAFSEDTYAIRLARAFLIWSTLWVVTSDYIAANIAPTQHSFWMLQTQKGLAYVGVSSLLIWLAVRALERDEASARAANELRLKLLKESGLLAVAGWLPDGALTYGNKAFYTMLGYSAKELQGRYGKTFIAADYADAHQQARQELAQHGRTQLHRFDLIRKDGSRVPVVGGLATVGDTQESISYFVDITPLIRSEEARLKLQEQLLHSEKVNALGHFASGMAHNFNNELSIIVGSASLLEEQLPSDVAAQRNVQLILKAAERSRKLIQQLLAFSRKQASHFEAVDMNRLVDNLQPMIRQLISQAIEMKVRLSGEPELIYADPSQLEQVMLNLTSNARDAMPRGGVLAIEVGHAPLASEAAGGPAVEHVTVKVSDTGIGMDEVTMQSIFEPFFTTKSATGGTGLGLSTVHGLVKQNNGIIDVTSRVKIIATIQVKNVIGIETDQRLHPRQGVIHTLPDDFQNTRIGQGQDLIDLAPPVRLYPLAQHLARKQPRLRIIDAEISCPRDRDIYRDDWSFPLPR
jgi:PAS domain S-box-containing protein